MTQNAAPKKPESTKKKPDKKKVDPIITSDKQLTLITPDIEQLEL